MDSFRLGQITAPVGIKGEIRVYPYPEYVRRFNDIRELFIEGEKEKRTVEKCRMDKNMLVLKLSGINDRNTSELMRGKHLSLPKAEIELEDNDYFIDDLVGMDVLDESGKKLGVLKDVVSNISQDRYLIEGLDGRSFELPAVREFIIDVNTSEKTMIVRLIEGITDL
jgi:16S rRNA processing protein RimM